MRARLGGACEKKERGGCEACLLLHVGRFWTYCRVKVKACLSMLTLQVLYKIPHLFLHTDKEC